MKNSRVLNGDSANEDQFYSNPKGKLMMQQEQGVDKKTNGAEEMEKCRRKSGRDFQDSRTLTWSKKTELQRNGLDYSKFTYLNGPVKV